MKLRKFAALCAFVLLMTGCSTTITNLTPSQLPKNPQNLYPFDVAFDTSQKSIRENTIKPYVLIGTESYPMQPAPQLKDRWEAMVPLAQTNDVIYYRFKFDYDFDRIPKAGSSSRLSPTYQLQLSE